MKQNPKQMGEIHETMKGTTCEKWYTDNGVSYDAFRMAFRSLGLENFGKKRVLTMAEISRIENYPFRKQKDKPKPKEKKTPRTYTVTPSAPKEDREETGRAYGAWIKSDWFLVAVMLICLSTQVIHSAGFFFHNSPVEHPLALHIALSILFALGIDLVALVMTAHNGSRIYLYIYAGIHFVVNLLFHIQEYLLQDFIDLSLFEFGIKALGATVLSAVLAFSLFSYVELFTKGFKR